MKRRQPFVQGTLECLPQIFRADRLAEKSVAPFFIASTTFRGEEAPEITIMIGRSLSIRRSSFQGFETILARHDPSPVHSLRWFRHCSGGNSSNSSPS